MQKERIPWSKVCSRITDPSAHDLLDRMLELDHTKRIKATEVLDHKFFDEIRAEREMLDQ